MFGRKNPQKKTEWSWDAYDADKPRRERHHQLAMREQQKRERALAVVAWCRVIGGHGLQPRVGELWGLSFDQEALNLTRDDGTSVSLPYSHITAFEIGGAGETTQGGGFWGGGFGLEGAAEGMLIASALNSLTTRTRIDTVICLQTGTAELFLHNDCETPSAMRIRLSRVFSSLRQLHASTSSGRRPEVESGGSTIDQLLKLGDLVDKGLISPEEFARLKADLLG